MENRNHLIQINSCRAFHVFDSLLNVTFHFANYIVRMSSFALWNWVLFLSLRNVSEMIEGV